MANEFSPNDPTSTAQLLIQIDCPAQHPKYFCRVLLRTFRRPHAKEERRRARPARQRCSPPAQQTTQHPSRPRASFPAQSARADSSARGKGGGPSCVPDSRALSLTSFAIARSARVHLRGSAPSSARSARSSRRLRCRRSENEGRAPVSMEATLISQERALTNLRHIVGVRTVGGDGLGPRAAPPKAARPVRSVRRLSASSTLSLTRGA